MYALHKFAVFTLPYLAAAVVALAIISAIAAVGTVPANMAVAITWRAPIVLAGVLLAAASLGYRFAKRSRK